MNILLTGGAGYIGSHTALSLIEKGNSVSIIDNLTTGDKKLIPNKAKYYKCDIADQKLKELSVSQIELSQEMEAQKHKLHRAPALHKAHRIIRQVPKYQKKINNLRKDMKAITTLVEKMKTQSLDLQLRVQEAVLKYQEKNLIQSTNSKQ